MQSCKNAIVQKCKNAPHGDAFFCCLMSTPRRVAAKTRNWAMVKRILWSISPCGGSNIAHTAMMPATIRATADRISLTVHMAQYIPGAGARDVPEVKVYDVLP